MTIRLRDLHTCFEGVIPSIIATASQDGLPNISYLSHVALVDDEHVALSDQFFSKTAANIRANNNAAVMLVDPRDGSQYRLSVVFERSLDSGALFETMAAELRASSAQLGMADVMRLRGVDIYRVASVEAIPSPGAAIATSSPATSLYLIAAATLCGRISEAREIDAIVDAVLMDYATASAAPTPCCS
jgi:adenylate cyclase